MTSERDPLGMDHVALTEDGRVLVRYQGRVMLLDEAVRLFVTENHDPGDEHRCVRSK